MLHSCLFLVLTASSAPATAATPASETADDAVVNQRLDEIRDVLEGSETYAKVWQWGWLGVHAASVAGGGALAATSWDTKETRASMLGLAGKSVLSLGLSVAKPLVCSSAPAEFRQYPEDSPEARQKKVAAGEQLLASCADDARLKTSWVPHAMNFVVNLAAAAGTYAYLNSQPHGSEAYDSRLSTSAIGFGLGFGVITAKILSTPTASIQAVRERGGSGDSAVASEPQTSWQILPLPSGFLATVRF